MDDDVRTSGGGVLMAFVSAASFALSGSFASALFDSGWSPGAAVTVRILVAALVLLGPATVSMRGRWGRLRSNLTTFLLFGLLAVAGAQLFYFMAVQTLSVGVALMLEYMGLVLVVIYQWVVTRRPPRVTTLVGVALAVVGLVFVLDLFGGVQVDLGGVLWGLGAAFGLATYFVVAAKDDGQIPPIAVAAGGMVIGSGVLGLLGLAGVLPFEVAASSVVLSGMDLPWWVAIVGLGVVSGAVSYGTGVMAARMLGAKVSAFLGLTEVLFAVLFAWILLGQLPAPVQFLGGLLILIGITVVRREQIMETGIPDTSGMTTVESAEDRSST